MENSYRTDNNEMAREAPWCRGQMRGAQLAGDLCILQFYGEDRSQTANYIQQKTEVGDEGAAFGSQSSLP